jgi:hypothetical protein
MLFVGRHTVDFDVLPRPAGRRLHWSAALVIASVAVNGRYGRTRGVVPVRPEVAVRVKRRLGRGMPQPCLDDLDVKP